MKKITKNFPVFIFCFFSLVFSSAKSMAQGNLLVTPKRIVFEGNKKSEEINLANTGKDSANYMISFIQIKMNDDGSFEKITEPDSAQLFADKNIRFFPRMVTLAPNEAQTIKVQILRPNELQAGEYRSHLYLRANPAPKPLGEEVTDQKDSVLSVRMVPVFGISIPIIIRKGEYDATVSISDLTMEEKMDKTTTVYITFNRKGNMSVYGDVVVSHISPGGKVTNVGNVKGLAVYTPNALRRFQLILDNNSTVNYHAGKLKVQYTDHSAKAVKLAEAEIDLN